jgi:hypothetical protein
MSEGAQSFEEVFKRHFEELQAKGKALMLDPRPGVR